jgi:hypothetical protein
MKNQKKLDSKDGLRIAAYIRVSTEERGGVEDLPAALRDYAALTSKLALLADAPEAKHAILSALIERVEVTAEGFKIHYFVGREKIKRELAKTSSRLNSNPEFLDSGSNSLTNGAGERT